MHEGVNDFMLKEFTFLPNLSVTLMDNKQNAVNQMKNDGFDIFNDQSIDFEKLSKFVTIQMVSMTKQKRTKNRSILKVTLDSALSRTFKIETSPETWRK